MCLCLMEIAAVPIHDLRYDHLDQLVRGPKIQKKVEMDKELKLESDNINDSRRDETEGKQMIMLKLPDTSSPDLNDHQMASNASFNAFSHPSYAPSS